MLTYFCMLNVKRKVAVFADKYNVQLCLDVCASANSHPKFLGAQYKYTGSEDLCSENKSLVTSQLICMYVVVIT